MPCLEQHPSLKLEQQILLSTGLLPSPRFLCVHSMVTALQLCTALVHSQGYLFGPKWRNLFFIWSKLEKSIFPELKLGKFWIGTSDGDLESQVHVRHQITFFLGVGYFRLMKMRFSNKNDNSYIPFSVFYFLTLFLLITSFSRKKKYC